MGAVASGYHAARAAFQSVREPSSDSGAPRIALGSQCLDSQSIQFGVRACYLIADVLRAAV